MTEPEESPQDTEEALNSLLESEADNDQVDQFLDELSASDAARAVSRLDWEAQERLLTRLSPSQAAHLVVELCEVQAAGLLDGLDPSAAAEILHELPGDERVDLLSELPESSAETILEEMSPEDAELSRRLGAYDSDSAGGLMIAELVTYPAGATVGDVVKDLRRQATVYRDYQVQYLYIVDDQSRLVGVLPLRRLLQAEDDTQVDEAMIPDPLTVLDQDTLEELIDFFDRHHFLAVPVVDADGRLVGVVHNEAVNEAEHDRSDDDYRKASGLVREELRSMPLLLRSRRRLSWLSVNIVLNIVAASVIAAYQETLAEAIALAVFLPVISDMSGCSGNQAVAVSMRELSLGLVRTNEKRYVFIKEASVGVINGIMLGAMVAGAAYLWKGNPYLGAVVGLALAINTIIAVIVGGIVPLVLKHWGKDPALAAGPILTTVTDICGFFLVFALASGVLDRL